MTGISRFIPVAVVIAMIVLFFTMMGGDRNPQEIKSVLIDKPVPSFSLPMLGMDKTITEAVLITGKPVLVNFFASWCAPCRAEHENLMKIGASYGVSIVGIAYKDTPEKAQVFLNELGNPYSLVLMDQDGRAAIDWGVTGVPETFLIDSKGIIHYRHWGPIIGDSLEKRLLPRLQEISG
ncbi:DsbE family thiol:disulfide interchange protein [Kordiimonas pumila]|uniref:DsbE family thiol:disulfide interchange protein n=1 Tax=Kordiimonas pumila TaxID=2161677 RepID=A0ABV7D437_9PROT|nr:DsbE family thiol:disulfide interchange protein [Kordiimonas pumila]